jgi:NAD(P)-dependent dehydrogenase (short-subunit alcohol dehydrogenase family)
MKKKRRHKLTDTKQCWAVNVKGQMALVREAMPTFNANPEGGVFIITSSIAGTSLAGSSMAYSVTKAAQIHLMRCLANTQGSKVRINAVLPGLLLTDWVRNIKRKQFARMLQTWKGTDNIVRDYCIRPK